jgi:hypothetical protein
MMGLSRTVDVVMLSTTVKRIADQPRLYAATSRCGRFERSLPSGT